MLTNLIDLLEPRRLQDRTLIAGCDDDGIHATHCLFERATAGAAAWLSLKTSTHAFRHNVRK